MKRQRENGVQSLGSVHHFYFLLPKIVLAKRKPHPILTKHQFCLPAQAGAGGLGSLSRDFSALKSLVEAVHTKGKFVIIKRWKKEKTYKR